MLQIKYDHRHTFLISIGIIVLLFGLYPFYLYDFESIPLKMKIFHVFSILLGLYLCWNGKTIWSKKDEDQQQITNYYKEQMKGNNELRKIEKERRRIDLDKQKMELEISSAKKEKKKIKKISKKKLKEIKEQKDALIKKEKELLKKEEKIYDERNEQINRLPTSFSVESSVGSPEATSVNSPYVTGSNSVTGLMNVKKCINCGRYYQPTFIGPDTGVCPLCLNLTRY